MGRHSMDYRPPADAPVDDSAQTGQFTHTGQFTEASNPEASIAPPGGPIDPGVPGAPDAPGYPGTPGYPDAPSTVPTEPPPVAPENPDDGAAPAPGTWHAAGSDLL